MSKPISKLGSGTILDELCYLTAHLSKNGNLEKSQALYHELVERKNVLNIFEASKFMNRAKPDEKIPEDMILGCIDAAITKKDWGDFRAAMDAFVENNDHGQIFPLIDLAKKHSADEQKFPLALIALRIADKMITSEKNSVKFRHLAAAIPEIFENTDNFKETFEVTFKKKPAQVPYILVLMEDFLVPYNSIFNMTVGNDPLKDAITSTLYKNIMRLPDPEMRRYYNNDVLENHALQPSEDAARNSEKKRRAPEYKF